MCVSVCVCVRKKSIPLPQPSPSQAMRSSKPVNAKNIPDGTHGSAPWQGRQQSQLYLLAAFDWKPGKRFALKNMDSQVKNPRSVQTQGGRCAAPVPAVDIPFQHHWPSHELDCPLPITSCHPAAHLNRLCSACTVLNFPPQRGHLSHRGACS